MAYAERYNFTFNETQDRRQPTVFNSYEVKILKRDYVGEIEEIEAVENPVQISYNAGSEKIFEPLMGSEATLNLIATEDFQLEDLYTEDELEWLVAIYRNASLIWRGFIIPDGCQESFTFAPYTISTNAVDTLGLLKNLAYVQNDGNFWLGKQSFIEVIYNCLNRVEIPDINIYTSVNLYEISYPDGAGDDPLALTFVNAERFLNEDGINPMNCDEVLKSIMHLWTAKIVQSEGDWYIFRPSELYFGASIGFRKYVNGAFDSVVTKNVSKLLGGESEGIALAPLFHTDTDQLKMIEKPYKNFSMSFKFGSVSSLLKNPKFDGWNGVNFTDWIKSTITLPLSEEVGGGARIGNITAYPGPYEYIESVTPALITTGDRLVFSTEYYYENSESPLVRVALTDGSSTTWYLNQNGSWSPTEAFIETTTSILVNGITSITSQPAPTTGDLKIRLYEARLDPVTPMPIGAFVTYFSANITPYLDAENPIGEKHTANQTGKYSFAPDTINVLNGDSSTQLYLSSMYKTNQVNLTSEWKRKYATESLIAEPFQTNKKLLRLAVEETQRMYAKPFVKFDGSIFGYFPPLSRFSINLLEGYFIPLGLTYDLQANKVKATLARINDTEIEQDYELMPDYGTTTKVLVK